MERFLLFTTGVALETPLSLTHDDVAVFNSKSLAKMEVKSPDVLTLTFNVDGRRSLVDLQIKGGQHASVIQSISNAVRNGTESVIAIADVDNNIFAHPSIVGVTILTKHTYVQNLTGNSRTLVELPYAGYRSCLIANVKGSGVVAITLELYDGTTYYKFLDQINLLAKTTLVLDENEISFDEKTYSLYATSSDSSGNLTLTFNF